MAEKNIIEIRIAGTEYRLKGSENDEYMHKIASFVDKKMQDIINGNTRLSTSMAAVLSSINIADDLHKLYLEVEQLKRQIKLLQKDNARYKAEYEHILKESKEIRNKQKTTQKSESQ